MGGVLMGSGVRKEFTTATAFIQESANKHEIAEVLASISYRLDAILLKETNPASRGLLDATVRAVRKCSVAVDTSINLAKKGRG
jgi:hypothetical protein